MDVVLKSKQKGGGGRKRTTYFISYFRKPVKQFRGK